MGITNVITECRKNYQEFLFVQKALVESYFPWLKVVVKNKLLIADGTLEMFGKSYNVSITYSPFYEYRFDRIFLRNAGIKFNSAIHVYSDLSLCLYHPKIDMPLFKTVSLVDMVSWIPEWCVHYQEWKKYGVWLGKEIKH
ncbi:hypothetical protein [Pedobacter cryophilus]|uniref:Type II CBASS E2 protein domain-containing protein n=1 Tax=Pedobacter cryophilus TaxID=2571271 RepID=A0A4U1C288_9SPHI|nr:hypothetical protein [Pedobacter cryophilus]TKB99144.1 hypothetical protein FA046_08535 [Pedobacter cryophilus]